MKNESKIKKLRLQIKEIEFLISFLKNDQERKQECQNIDSVNPWEQGPVYKFISACIKSIAKENSLDIDELSKGMDISKESNLIPFHKAAPLMKVGDKFRPDLGDWGDFELCEDVENHPCFKTEYIKIVTLSPNHFNLMGEIIQSSSGDSEPANEDEKVQLIAIDIGKEKKALRLMLNNGLISDEYYNKSIEAVLERPVGIKIKLSNQEPKQTELMTLQEAIIKSNPGDQIHGKGLKFIMKDNGALYYTTEGESQELACLMKRDFQSNGWIVVPAEPKVLGEKEHWKASSFAPNLDNRGYFKLGHRDGKEDGQLEQWLNHKELRKAVESFVEYFNHLDGSNVVMFRNALKNLKPLNPE